MEMEEKKAGQTRKKSSKSGMNLPVDDGRFCFTVEEVCSILKASCEAGVEELSLFGLKARFHSGERTGVGRNPETIQQEKVDLSSKIEEFSKESLVLDELREREERVRMMVIEDPSEFERQLSDGDLIDKEDSEEDDGI